MEEENNDKKRERRESESQGVKEDKGRKNRGEVP